MDPRKEAICNALAAFIRQRPGFEYANYGDAASYRADVRRAGKDKAQAETLLAAVRWRDSITADDMLKAAQSGRLSVRQEKRCQRCGNRTVADDALCLCGGPLTTALMKPTFRVGYTAGQYWCIEYRAGVCRYLAGLLWDYTRDHGMPKGRLVHNSETGETFERYQPGDVPAGTWLRNYFRREFGSAIQRRWFN